MIDLCQYSKISFIVGMALTQLSYSQNVAGEDSRETHKARTAYMYRADNVVLIDDIEFPCRGNKELIKQLSEVRLNFQNHVHHYQAEGVILEEAINFIALLMPAKSKFELLIDNEIKNLPVSGTISCSLADSLVSLMHKGGFFCEITDGIIKLKSDGSRGVHETINAESGRITVTQKVFLNQPAEDMPNADPLEGSAMLYAAPFGPGPYDDELPTTIYHTGNARLIAALKSITLVNIERPLIENSTLDKIAVIINSKINPDHNWKVYVSDDAKLIESSVILNSNLLITLNLLMRKNENFDCRITKGKIEFVRSNRVK